MVLGKSKFPHEQFILSFAYDGENPGDLIMFANFLMVRTLIIAECKDLYFIAANPSALYYSFKSPEEQIYSKQIRR